MTWTEKLEKLIAENEFLFMEEKASVENHLKSQYAQELVSYLNLDSLGLSPVQKGWTIAVFLHVIASYSKGDRVSVDRLLNLMSSGLRDYSYIEEAIKLLEIKQILIKKSSRFRPKPEVILEAIPMTVDKIINHLPLPELNSDEIESKKLLALLRDNGHELNDYFAPEVRELIDSFISTDKLSYIKKINTDKNIIGESKYLLIILIARHLSDSGSNMRQSAAVSLPVKSSAFNKQLSDNKSKLNELGLIVCNYLNIIGEVSVCLTQKALDHFGIAKKGTAPKEKTGGGGINDLPELGDHSEQEFFKIIPASEIEEEQLFYNQRLAKDLDFYKNLLNKDDEVYKQNKAITGRITLMFDGLPGTGKTAVAQQLAKQSNRDLVHVNWQTFRGQWVGQSEKNLKSLLDEIDSMSEKGKRVPIVLFNEAEAFLSQRIAINQSTDRMENNLVSMLLEWLEKKNPFCIVIFTSNHRQLMDKAFERRISHLTFDAPDEQTRFQIWKTLFSEKEINENQYDELAQYPLTGAEIAQVLKTYHLHKIAYDKDATDLGLLHQLCNGQKWMEQKSTIGFKRIE